MHVFAKHTQIPISLRSVLILSSELRLGLPKHVFSAGLPANIFKTLPLSSILAALPVHLNLLDLITLTVLRELYKLLNFSLWSHLHFPLSYLLGPSIYQD